MFLVVTTPKPPSGAPHLCHGPLQREGAPEMAGRDSDGQKKLQLLPGSFFAKKHLQ